MFCLVSAVPLLVPVASALVSTPNWAIFHSYSGLIPDTTWSVDRKVPFLANYEQSLPIYANTICKKQLLVEEMLPSKREFVHFYQIVAKTKFGLKAIKSQPNTNVENVKREMKE